MGRSRGLVAIAIVAILAGACGAPATAPGTSPATSPTASGGATPSGTATGPPPSGPTPGPTLGATPSPRGSLDPTAIATRLYAAADVAAATPPLRQVYAYLGVGLYTADGVQIQAGAETGPDDFYLYDFESDLLAQAYIDGNLSPVDALAAFLGDAGVGWVDTGQPLTGSELMAILAEAVGRARADESLFTLRLVDSLGLVRSDPLDLARPDLDPATTELDPIQQFLLLYDILAGLPVQVSAAMAGQTADLLSAAACQFQGSGGSRRGGSTLGGSSNAGRTGAGGLNSVHKQTLASGYKVGIQPDDAFVHWWHGEADDQILTMYAVVYWSLEASIACGTGRGFPTFGDPPTEGTNVFWTLGDPELAKNGSFQNTTFKTVEGEAKTHFYPKTEYDPKQGPTKTAKGTIGAFIFGGSSASAPITVERHQNLTLEMEGSLSYSSGQFSVTFNYKKLTVPLRGSGGEFTGSGTGEMSGRATFVGICTADYLFPSTANVKATGTDPLSFTVSGTGSGAITVYCPEGERIIGVPIGPESKLSFRLAAKDGATYTYTPPAPMTGSVTFTLREPGYQ